MAINYGTNRPKCQQVLPDGSTCLRPLYNSVSRKQRICGVCAREKMQRMGAVFNGKLYIPPARDKKSGVYAGVFHSGEFPE